MDLDDNKSQYHLQVLQHNQNSQPLASVISLKGMKTKIESLENTKPSSELGFIRMLEARNLHPISVADDANRQTFNRQMLRR